MTKARAARLTYPLAIAATCCVVLIVLFWQGLVVTVVPIGGDTAGDSQPSAGLSFSPKAYVARIWPAQVVPTVSKDAVPLPELLAALAKDRPAALKTYANKVGGTENMLVRFTGKVGAIDTSTPIGTLTVDVANGGTTVPVHVAIGPVILGTTLRDALKFISFGEFLNQIQYGDVADELNSMVTAKVVTPDAAAKLKGRIVAVSGAYAYDDGDPQKITVTPVILTVDKGGS